MTVLATRVMKGRRESVCPICRGVIRPGAQIAKLGGLWQCVEHVIERQHDTREDNPLNVTVEQLTPGDLVEQVGTAALYVSQAQHPIWPHLRLVIWQLRDGTWSFDALDPGQEVGVLLSQHEPPGRREQRLRAALLGQVTR